MLVRWRISGTSAISTSRTRFALVRNFSLTFAGIAVNCAVTCILPRDEAKKKYTLIIATAEEGGIVDRLAPYYGPTPSPQRLAATDNPQQSYAQSQLHAGRMLASCINTDFAPLADVYQGGAVS